MATKKAKKLKPKVIRTRAEAVNVIVRKYKAASKSVKRRSEEKRQNRRGK